MKHSNDYSNDYKRWSDRKPQRDVTESNIISSNSDEVKEQAKKKVKEVINYLNQEEVRKLLMAKLINEYDWLEANKILDILIYGK